MDVKYSEWFLDRFITGAVEYQDGSCQYGDGRGRDSSLLVVGTVRRSCNYLVVFYRLSEWNFVPMWRACWYSGCTLAHSVLKFKSPIL